MLETPDLDGGGGAERLFADAFDAYQRLEAANYELFSIVDDVSLARLRGIGRLATARNVVVLPAYTPAKVRLATLTVGMVAATLKYRIDLIHLVLPKVLYLPFAVALSRLPRSLRPAVALNVVDCSVPRVYFSTRAPDPYGSRMIHRAYFRLVQLDGIFTWYNEFRKSFERANVRGDPEIFVSPYCLVETPSDVDWAAKRNEIILVGRLVEAKQPLLFVDAVAEAFRLAPRLFDSWTFSIYGTGPLRSAVEERVQHVGLGERFVLGNSPDMRSILARSKIFVSAQDFENYSSLAMLEAMALGNAIVARDVGETWRFVESGKNGLVVGRPNAAELACALVRIAADPQLVRSMGEYSRTMAARHSPVTFLNQLERFWDRVLTRRDRAHYQYAIT
jgi:glycosyltransferase involved in cell wall biosynthesis